MNMNEENQGECGGSSNQNLLGSQSVFNFESSGNQNEVNGKKKVSEGKISANSGTTRKTRR